ncbi:MAG: 16S rRNA (guanine(527)-N(7))-methyltransferase RsmG, partial [Sphingosinicella sp.]
MDEQSTRAWLHGEFDVSRETLGRLDRLAALVREENRRQNLVSARSLEHLWWRHIADSAQLIRFAPAPSASWIDLGSGAGFPGLVVALLHRGPVTLVEERRLRADFLL